MRNKLMLSIFLIFVASNACALLDTRHYPESFEIELTAGAYEMDTNDTNYGFIASQLTNIEALRNEPKYQFGGTVLLRYFLCDSNLNVDASYTGNRARYDDNVSGNVESQFVFFNNGNGPISAQSDYDFNFDFANIELGSLIDFKQNRLMLNPQIGLSYAHLKGEQTVNFSQANNNGTLSNNNHFRGLGPSIGMNMNFGLNCAFYLSGNFRYSALIGKTENTLNAISTQSVTFNTNSKDQVVSLIQTELALGMDLEEISLSQANLAIGYQVTKVFDVLENVGIIFGEGAFLNKSIHGAFVRFTKGF